MMTSLTLDIDGPVHVVDHGGQGQVMLLVHGLGGSLLDWIDVAPALAATHHVYAVDLLGFGRTPLAGRHAQLGDNWRLVDAVIDRLSPGQPVVLVGNSMGGLVSLVEAAKRPHKVSHLVLVDPALPRSGPRRLFHAIELAFIMLAVPGLGNRIVSRRARRLTAERLVDEALQLCAVDSTRIAPSTRQAHIELTEWRGRQDQPYRAFVEASKSLVRWLWNAEDVHRFAHMTQAPTLLLSGDRDRVVAPRNARAVAALRPDWTYYEFEDTGHIPQMERPREFLDVVGSWLARAGAESDDGVRLAVSG